MLTVSPSIRISPASMGWMPATHLISVDLPAPLSPTSAITSPLRTSRSTSVSACTEPNDFETPRSSRKDVWLTMRVSYHRRGGGARGGAPPPVVPSSYLQNFANVPVQTSLFFRYFAEKRIL